MQYGNRPVRIRIAPPSALDVRIRYDLLRGTVRVTDMEFLSLLSDANPFRDERRVPHRPPQTLQTIFTRFMAAQPVHDHHVTTLAPENVPLPVHAVVSRGFGTECREVRAVVADTQGCQRGNDHAVTGRFEDPDAVAHDRDGIVKPGRRADVIPVRKPGPVVPRQPDDRVGILVSMTGRADAFQQQVLALRLEIAA